MVKERLIHPVVLCGGGGTRLWPVSRVEYPKPFLPLIGGTTMFEQAVRRVADFTNEGDGGLRFAAPIVVAGAQHGDLIETQMRGAEYRLIVEPAAKNTAPAIALAAAMLPADDVMLVCPSDQHIADEAAFRNAVSAAARLAEQDYLVSFGITPDRAETGYGYLRRGLHSPKDLRLLNSLRNRTGRRQKPISQAANTAGMAVSLPFVRAHF
jgi:mannose-1-phosphate guanylyltransferase/mannose-1-phosphate guanylyltransferase/mannose-6-phosphate isomerase